ncbi:hypothetical protein RJ640_005934 [Escallonia rubra]|uniref:Rhamnogalacturonan endolyase n=1 Tax=Escallonia rubra TaxID=112253 RepID=A0AA88R4E7_9ASTE|nr:hypothetical protein RJ640_005934 [Escallonia rubra]
MPAKTPMSQQAAPLEHRQNPFNNGIPGGILIGVQYNGIDNVLELHNKDLNGGFWDLNWSPPGSRGTRGKFDTFVVLCGRSGFYSYAIFEHSKDMPAFNLNETRIAFMLRKDKFHYMAIADNRQRYMPHPDDRLPGRGQELDYPEAVLLVNPIEPEFKGEVDDKYQYSCDNKDNKVHGWICFDPPVGFWQIAPSNEFRTGGPLKQDLTSHVNPTTLAMFVSSHYAGEDLVVKFGTGEIWKKVFGPVFIYLNSVSDGAQALSLWDDAKYQMKKEVKDWPYSFPALEYFQGSNERGSVRGRLLVQDRYINMNNLPAKDAYVGLAAPGDTGSWQRECKGYQFWVTADEGSRIEVGDLVYNPPRDGPTLWEIGIPDRSAREFYIPDPNPKYINKLYVNHPDRFRQYGLWERYADLYLDGDLVYTVGVSDYKKDWFFAQVTRKVGDNAYKGSTWQIKFKIENLEHSSGTYILRLALASAHQSELQVRINNPEANPPLFSSGEIGSDNAIARHGIHGIYWLYFVEIPAAQFVQGENTIFFTQAMNTSPFQGIMYDYIRLEAPSPSFSVKRP